MPTVYTTGPHLDRAHRYDAGLDLVAAESVTLAPMAVTQIATGSRVAVPIGAVGFVCPRSGLGLNEKVILAPSPGVVDAGYRGELMVGLLNLSGQPYQVEAGQRIAQLVIVPLVAAAVVNTGHLPAAVDQRGADGIGSTGKS